MPFLVLKKQCLMDEPTKIAAQGLQPGFHYKITCSVDHRTGTHSSYAVFTADKHGAIDTEIQAPMRGTYDGIHGTGLFASMFPTGNVRHGATVWATPPLPYKYNVKLYDSGNKLLDEMQQLRVWRHPAVREVDIENEIFTGTLYLPPGNGPFPTILDFAGTGGGIRQHRAALFASHGFASLALPYFQYKNLPKSIDKFDLRYFLNVIDWLSEQPFVGKIGLQGNSFGGVICYSLANLSTKISGFCIINSLHTVDPIVQFNIDGKPVVTAKYANTAELTFEGEAVRYSGVGRHLIITSESEFHFNNCPKHVQFRLVASMDDASTDAVYCAFYMKERLQKEGLECEVDVVPGGHLMEPPYLPHMPVVYSGFTQGLQLYGGDVFQHGKSQELVWKNTLSFFERVLGKGIPPPKIVDNNASKL